MSPRCGAGSNERLAFERAYTNNKLKSAVRLDVDLFHGLNN